MIKRFFSYLAIAAAAGVCHTEVYQFLPIGRLYKNLLELIFLVIFLIALWKVVGEAYVLHNKGKLITLWMCAYFEAMVLAVTIVAVMVHMSNLKEICFYIIDSMPFEHDAKLQMALWDFIFMFVLGLVMDFIAKKGGSEPPALD